MLKQIRKLGNVHEITLTTGIPSLAYLRLFFAKEKRLHTTTMLAFFFCKKQPTLSQIWAPVVKVISCRFTVSALLIIFSVTAFADPNNDPCVGPTALLSIVDRPTFSDSACTVADKKGVLELGVQAQKLYPGRGYQYNLPEAELRIGLPNHTEFVFLAPNYIHQSIRPHAGFTTSIVGIKHRLSATQTLQTAIEGLFSLPTGSDNFGSYGLGAAVNGIISYNMTSTLNFTLMLGASTEAQPTNAGGQHATSINPDAVVTWSLNDKTDLYVEVYGQSKTGPGLGSGFNSDSGIIYLLLPNLTVDAEVGQRISGAAGNFSHYFGAGMAIAF